MFCLAVAERQEELREDFIPCTDYLQEALYSRKMNWVSIMDTQFIVCSLCQGDGVADTKN
ncbi:hypothetical protein SPACI_021610 [Sporomusa acidovorans DSM 3132]|uniref:Uncharacterized protein n=1 Tax=Sporomusa acidovorans (strain ATCC 49682 / DSM 3132 / Mol) TaxID=1123286 RepID=A0ABZ3J241_SPOA4|nr:hypothetical protein SPACI_56290 [Sporomusa acidovorans DSM 3132]SDE86116.1 hypothetical protein SAMN04488499_102423 [Sporomusa acidovorans]